MPDHTTPETLVDSIFTVPTITESVNAAGEKVYKGRLLVSVADRVNRNSRLYPLSEWRREAAKSKALIAEGLLTGQAEHPDGRPELLNTILKFTTLELEESTGAVYGGFEVINTSKGLDFAAIARAGVAIGCSTRALGDIKREKRDGQDVGVISNFQLKGVDVMLFGEQSVPNARLMQFEHVAVPPVVPLEVPPVVPIPVPPPESAMSEPTTPDELRTAHPALVEALEQPLQAELSTLKTANVALTTERAALQSNLDAEQALTANLATLLSLTEGGSVLDAVRALQESVSTAQAQAKAAQDRDAAFRYVVAQAKAQKHGALLIVEHLSDVATVAEAEAQFPRAVKFAQGMIETALLGAGEQVAEATDAAPAAPPAPPTPAAKEVLVDEFPHVASIASGQRFKSKP